MIQQFKKLVFRRGNSPNLRYRLLLLGSILAICAKTFAQPANDNCNNATTVSIGAGNFGIGVYASSQSDLTGATIQFGEPFHSIQVSAGTDKKSVWYKFVLPTHRGVRIELKQPANNIPQADAGFTVFYAAACMPTLGDIPPAKLTPLNKFGSSFNPCLEPGTYYVQVSSKDNINTNYPIFIEITTSYPAVLNTYDRHTAPHSIGTLSGNTGWLDYDVGCLTIEATSENCPALGANYTQSSWHTFTTDSYVDFVRFEIRQQNIITGGPNWSVGFILYQGNCVPETTPWTTLPVVQSCVVLTNGSPSVDLRCVLQPNTTYSVQLLYHKDLEASTGIRLQEVGAGITRAPNPAAIPIAHQLGALPGSPGGTWTTLSDAWGCNARMSLYRPCGTTINTDYTQGGYTYDMNDWVTFTVSGYVNIYFSVNSGGCIANYVRIYNGNVGTNCNAGLYTSFTTNTTINCMPPGTYSMQVLGVSGGAVLPNCNNSHLSQSLSVQIRVTTVQQENKYGLQSSTRSDTIVRSGGLHLPLQDGVQYTSTYDAMGCSNTVLPGSPCTGSTKATYRIIKIGDSDGDGNTDYGTLTIGGVSCGRFSYRLYRGNARTEAINAGTFNAGQTIPNLTPVTACFCISMSLCVEPGDYTLVTFGTNSDVGAGDQPWVRFDKTESQFNLYTVNRVNRINYSGGSHVALTSGTSYQTTLDKFDCRNTVLPAGDVCGGTNRKAIYRTFKVGGTGLLMVYGTCGNTYKVYSGDASALASAQGLFTPEASYPKTITGLTDVSGCFSGYCWGGGWCDYSPTIEICVTPGIYTLVSFTDDNIWNVGRTDQPTIRFDAKDNLFNLANASRFNNVNGGTNLPFNTNITSTSMHFDCYKTVLPAGDICGVNHDRAMYRIFKVGASGVLTISGLNTCFYYRLYGGNAATLVTQFTYPNKISGLDNLGLGCYSGYSITYCITPGTYTLVSFGDDYDKGLEDQPVFRLSLPSTKFYDPVNGFVNNMGNMNSGGSGIQDTFSCMDNSRTIDGKAPCSSYTKLIYRQFELTQPVNLAISGGAGVHRIFKGWATDTPASYSNLTFFSEPGYPLDPDNDPDPRYLPVSWDCFSFQSTAQCHKFPPGKYTIVTYGDASMINQPTNVSLSVAPDPLPPKYNRPSKAYVANGGAPLTWCAACDGVAYPLTKVSYTFDFDRYDCSKDLPQPYIEACAVPNHDYNRTSYFVFTLSQESYVRINNVDSSFRQRLYPLDVRTADSVKMSTSHPSYIAPIQNCLERTDYDYGYCGWEPGEMEFCRLQPGTYTLVLFAQNRHVGASVQPIVVVEKVEESRFDHARTAYDFGAVPGNNVQYYGKVGDVNPIHSGRAPSNDFFSCKAGARPTDPTNNCPIGDYPVIGQSSVPYPMPINHAIYERLPGEDSTRPLIRRNLWYTFVVNGAGTIRVRVYNKTATENAQYPWSIYASDVDGTLPWSTVVATNQVDSTIAQGLSLVANSGYCAGYCCCYNYQQLSFTRDACSGTPQRYYVLVDHNIFLELNNQVEVSVQYDSIPSFGVRYDHYSHANRINGLNQINPPYTNVNLQNGIYRGDTASFMCATKDPSDQNSCGTRTLWYRVDITTVGRIRVNYDIVGGGTGLFNNNNIQLYRDINPLDNDSTATGLQGVSLYGVTSGGMSWGESCITPGRYYIMLTGCSYTNQAVIPRVQLIHRPVVYDFYSQANAINGLNQKQPPYTYTQLSNGTYLGDTATFACATKSPASDQNTCGIRTLWYYIDVNSTGKLRVNFDVIGTGRYSDTSNVQVYRMINAGDSTITGLSRQTLTQFSGNGMNWAQTCVTSGRYYIMLTGCWFTTEDVVPRVWLYEEPGDFCTRPANISLNGAGSASSTLTVDCHTIGEAFGENGSNMGCLFGPSGYKSSVMLIVN